MTKRPFPPPLRSILPKPSVLLLRKLDPGYNCPTCGKTYMHEDSLSRHIRTQHSLKDPLKCPHCMYRVSPSRGSYMKIHIRKRHPDASPLSSSAIFDEIKSDLESSLDPTFNIDDALESSAVDSFLASLESCASSSSSAPSVSESSSSSSSTTSSSSSSSSSSSDSSSVSVSSACTTCPPTPSQSQPEKPFPPVAPIASFSCAVQTSPPCPEDHTFLFLGAPCLDVTDPNALLVSSFRDQALLSADASPIQFTPLKVAAVQREEVVSLPDGTTYTLLTVIIGEPRPLSLRSVQTQCDPLP